MQSEDVGKEGEVPVSADSSHSGASEDDLAAELFAAKPRVPERKAAELERINVKTLGIAGPARGDEPVVRAGLPWPRVGRYPLLERLGRGAMGEVWVGLDTELGRKVALKQVRLRNVHHMDRLRREAQALARLSHPNVVAVYGVEKDHGQLFIAMELVEGQTLEQWRAQRPAPGWAECVRAYVQAGRGLAAAHAAGLVHRDFKPSNCMIDGQGRVKVLDFGLVSRAKVEVETSMRDDAPDAHVNSSADVEVDDVLSRSLTRTGMFVGTQAYMAPEALAGASISEQGDQFSFCVSLYEAVYGERPFEGDTRSGLVGAVMAGRVRAVPRASTVPSRLRRILLRGIEVDARRRWPSMDELLVALGQLVAPRTKRWIAIGAAGVGLMVGLALGWRQYANGMKSCKEGAEQIDESWDDERKSAIEAAILATKLPYAASTKERVISGLDEYSREWASMYESACEMSLRGEEQAEHEWGLERACLQESKDALNATVTTLTQADAQVAERAVGLVMGLPALERCDDFAQLNRHKLRLPPPEHPQESEGVGMLRKELALVKAEQDAGRYSGALALVEPIVARAEEIGYEPLLAEALYLRGVLRTDNGLFVESDQDMKSAFEIAIENEHEDVAFHAASFRASNLSLRRLRYDEAAPWGEVALAYARREGDPRRLARVFGILGHISFSKGDSVSAETYQRQAVKSLDEEGASPVLLADALSDLGRTLSEQGKHQEAEMIQRRGLRLREETLGDEHPDVAMSLNNLGIALEGQARYEEAEGCYRRSLAIRERALGPNDMYVANSLESLAALLLALEEYSEAERFYRRVLRIREQKSSGADIAVAVGLYNLGIVLRMQERYSEAESYQRRSLGMLDALVDEDHPQRLVPLAELALLAMEREDFEEARMHAEHAVSIVESVAVSPVTFAGVQYTLALALWPNPAERRRARVLATWALDRYVYVGAGMEEAIAEVAEWLATHEDP